MSHSPVPAKTTLMRELAAAYTITGIVRAFQSRLFHRVMRALGVTSTIIVVTGIFITSKVYSDWTLLLLKNQIRGLAPTLVAEIEGGGGTISQVIERLERLHAYLPEAEGYLVNREGQIVFAFANQFFRLGQKIDFTLLDKYLATDGESNEFLSVTSAKRITTYEVFSVAPITIEGRSAYLLLLPGSNGRAVLLTELFQSYGPISILGIIWVIGTLGYILTAIFLQILTKRLQALVEHASALAQGTYTSRIVDNETDEIGALSRSFNSMADAIQTNLETISQRDAIRRQLIADISHDLRGPLHVLRLGLDAVRSEAVKLNATTLTGDIFRPIDGNLNKLQQLLQELFDLAKLEANESPIERFDFEIAEFVHELVWRYSPFANSKGISLRAEVPEEELLGNANPELLQRALGNLIENAIRHTHPGGEICIRVALHDAMLRVAIIDTGVGIPPEEQKMVFERYMRGTALESHGGTGLGLTIVSKIIQAHGSEIHVVSQVGVGTEFWFELPRGIR